mmetsp:Transcript_86058/g.216642  ORF Transcript_86058/g.216642 Transcript_86058/m.216642 type:complete len:212 (+) Transcript_86058:246-881(+)
MLRVAPESVHLDQAITLPNWLLPVGFVPILKQATALETLHKNSVAIFQQLEAQGLVNRLALHRHAILARAAHHQLKSRGCLHGLHEILRVAPDAVDLEDPVTLPDVAVDGVAMPLVPLGDWARFHTPHLKRQAIAGINGHANGVAGFLKNNRKLVGRIFQQDARGWIIEQVAWRLHRVRHIQRFGRIGPVHVGHGCYRRADANQGLLTSAV